MGSAKVRWRNEIIIKPFSRMLLSYLEDEYEKYWPCRAIMYTDLVKIP